MTTFNPSMIVAASKSTEFAGERESKRSAKNILLDGIKKQVELFANPATEGRRWFTLGTKEVALTLRVQNKPLKLLGDETKVVVPVDQFKAAMEHFAKEVNADKFKAQLEEADKAMKARKAKMASTRAANKEKKPS